MKVEAIVVVVVVVVVVVMVVVVVVVRWRHWANDHGSNCSIRYYRSSWHQRRWLGRLSDSGGTSVVDSGCIGTLLVAQNRFKSNQSATTAKRACRYEPYVINGRPMQQTAAPSSDTAACSSNGGEGGEIVRLRAGSTNR